jgi:hypothetical protein
MLLGTAAGGLAFQHLFNQVNATTGAIALITQQLISRAGRIAKSAMHALAHNRLGTLRLRVISEFGTELDLHNFCASYN